MIEERVLFTVFTLFSNVFGLKKVDSQESRCRLVVDVVAERECDERRVAEEVRSRRQLQSQAHLER